MAFLPIQGPRFDPVIFRNEEKSREMDRLLGAVFGFARGVLIVTAAIFLASLTSAKDTDIWKESLTVPLAEQVMDIASPVLPEAIRDLRD